MGKSIFTMSAAQRLKAQEKQSKRFDRAVNKKFKAMKKAWKKKLAGKAFKGVAFVATAAAAGAVARKVKEIAKTKSSDDLREMAAKIKVKFDETKAAMKKQTQDEAAGQGSAELAKTRALARSEEESEKEAGTAQGAAKLVKEGAAFAAAQKETAEQDAVLSAQDGMPGTSDGMAGAVSAEKAAEEINRTVE